MGYQAKYKVQFPMMVKVTDDSWDGQEELKITEVFVTVRAGSAQEAADQFRDGLQRVMDRYVDSGPF